VGEGILVECKKVSDLKYAPYNPRHMPEEVLEKLKVSLRKFGYVEPLVWNKRTGHVVGGNQRLRALKELGVEEVDVVVVDLPLQQEKALNLALNKIQGEWDLPKLKEVFASLEKSLWELTGFETDFIEDLLKDFESIEPPDDFGVEEKEEGEIVFKVFCPVERKEELEELLERSGFRYKA